MELRNINVPQLVFGGLSVVAGVGAVTIGVVTILSSRRQAFEYGSGEVIESMAHINPVRNLVIDNLGISENDYELFGGLLTTASSFGIGVATMMAKVNDRMNEGMGTFERQLLSGSEWNEYFKQTYGSENVEWVTKNKASFGSRNLLEGHFDKHGSEFGGIYSNADEYLQGAKDVMNNVYKVQYYYNVTDK